MTDYRWRMAETLAIFYAALFMMAGTLVAVLV